MKKKRTFILPLLLLVMAMCMTGCSNDDEVTPQPEPDAIKAMQLVRFNKSESKAVISSKKDYLRYFRAGGQERIGYECLPDGQLLLKHSNVLFACSPDDINPSVVMESNKIQLMESQTIDQGGDIGIYDLEYVLSPFTSDRYMLCFKSQQLKAESEFTVTLDFAVGNKDEASLEYKFMDSDFRNPDYSCIPSGQYTVVTTTNSPWDVDGCVATKIEKAPAEAADSVWPCKDEFLYLPKEAVLADINRFPDGEYKDGIRMDVLVGPCQLGKVDTDFHWVAPNMEFEIDPPASVSLARDSIVGKWKEVRNSYQEIPDSRGRVMEFFEDGRVVITYPNYREADEEPHEVTIESAYEFEDDWQWYFGESKALGGHLSYCYWSYDTPDRYSCVFQDGQMRLCIDDGAYYYIDPTIIYKRITK